MGSPFSDTTQYWVVEPNEAHSWENLLKGPLNKEDAIQSAQAFSINHEKVFGVISGQVYDPIVFCWKGAVFKPEIVSVYVLEATYKTADPEANQLVYSDVICVMTDYIEAISYIKRNGKDEGWEDPQFIKNGFVFACYSIVKEALNDGDIEEVFIFNSSGQRVMNISDPRPYRAEGYKEDYKNG